MTLDSLNAFTVTVALQSVLWKYRQKSIRCKLSVFVQYMMLIKDEFKPHVYVLVYQLLVPVGEEGLLVAHGLFNSMP